MANKASPKKHETWWRKEIKWANLGFGYQPACHLMEPQCGKASMIYLLWRMVTAIYFVAILFYGASAYEHGAKWFIFISNWCFLLLVIYSVLNLICSVYHFYQAWKIQEGRREDYGSTPFVWQLCWFLKTINQVTAPMVALGYWLVVYEDFYVSSMYTITTHGINAIYILIDLWFCGMPVRLLQFYIPILYGVLYAVFTYIYYIAEGTDEYGRRAMYTYLDYKLYPEYSSATIVGLIVVALVTHLVIFAIHQLKHSLHQTYCCMPCRISQPNTDEAPEESYQYVNHSPQGYQYQSSLENSEATPGSPIGVAVANSPGVTQRGGQFYSSIGQNFSFVIDPGNSTRLPSGAQPTPAWNIDSGKMKGKTKGSYVSTIVIRS